MNLVHIGSELRRFGHGKLPPIALLTIMILPLLFGGLFVWSYWDPIGRMPDFPVALVNSDEGAELDGQETDAGSQITDKLLESKALKFIPVSPEEAQQGVEDGTYYFALEFPKDFSEAVTSVKGDDPHQATLNAVYNQDNGFLATTLGNQAVNVVLTTINAELGQRVTDNLLVGFNTLGAGMHQAGEGADKLADGAGAASAGVDRLTDGAGALEDGIAQADAGAKKLADGAGELNANLGTARDAADQLSDGLTQLNSATARLGNGAAQVSGGVDLIKGYADKASAAQESLVGPLVNISAQLRAVQLPVAVDLANQVDGLIEQVHTQGLGKDADLTGKINQLSEGAAEIARQLTDPAAEYKAGMDKATAGAGQLATGLHKLADGSQQLVIGAQTLSEGTSKLVDGSSQLTVGARQLGDGIVQLDTGSHELALKINEGAQQVPNYPDGVRDEYSSAMSTPVAVNTPGDTTTLFGMGLAPMFISLGLFMGATTTFMALRPLQRRAVDSGASPLRVALASYLPALVVGLGQATFMFLVQKFALGLDANNEVGMWLGMCATAAVFQMIVLGINALIGASTGRAVCIALMSLQVVSSGGLYPPETQPRFLQWFHTYDPMTYTVNLLRQMIFHADVAADPRLVQAMAVMALFFCVFLGVAMFGAWRARHMVMKDLHPELTL